MIETPYRPKPEQPTIPPQPWLQWPPSWLTESRRARGKAGAAQVGRALLRVGAGLARVGGYACLVVAVVALAFPGAYYLGSLAWKALSWHSEDRALQTIFTWLTGLILGTAPLWAHEAGRKWVK